LDEQGYRDLNEGTCVFFDRMYEIAAESAARAAETEETLKLYIGAIQTFERSPSRGPNTTVTVDNLTEDFQSGKEPPFEK
jgi:hypothetical protein